VGMYFFDDVQFQVIWLFWKNLKITVIYKNQIFDLKNIHSYQFWYLMCIDAIFNTCPTLNIIIILNLHYKKIDGFFFVRQSSRMWEHSQNKVPIEPHIFRTSPTCWHYLCKIKHEANVIMNLNIPRSLGVAGFYVYFLRVKRILCLLNARCLPLLRTSLRSFVLFTKDIHG
jgi:hypothetical protein